MLLGICLEVPIIRRLNAKVEIMRSKLLIGLIVLGTLSLTGCQNGWWPRWGAAGTTEDQQFRASVRDPYPSRDEGPELTGVRPQSYTRPTVEPVRSRNLHRYVNGQ